MKRIDSKRKRRDSKGDDGVCDGATIVLKMQRWHRTIGTPHPSDRDKSEAVARTNENWFEPAIRFVNAAIEATNLADSENDIAKRDFLRKNGSNLILRNKRLEFEAR
ncbi:MAG: hypothetical protein H7Z14_03325 [Anaerolineae bacterium]|nr:hypothetical protein [Phycisphaerae bacterium]